MPNLARVKKELEDVVEAVAKIPEPLDDGFQILDVLAILANIGRVVKELTDVARAITSQR